MKHFSSLFIIFILSSLSSSSFAHQLLPVENDDVIDLSPCIYYMQEDNHTKIDDIKELNSTSWGRIAPLLNQALTNKPFWIKFSLYNATGEKIQRYLTLGNPHLDKIRLYHQPHGEQMLLLEMGDAYPFSLRPMVHNQFIYPFDLLPNQVHTFYLRIETQGSASIPLALKSPNGMIRTTESQSLYQGLQLGALLAIGLLSLFIAVISRSPSYSLYAGYVLTATLLVATLHGLPARYMWPDWPTIQEELIPLLIPIGLTFILLFSERVLQLKNNNLLMLKLCRYSATGAVLLTLLVPFISYPFALTLDIIAVLTISLLLMVIAVKLSLQGHKLAKLYTFAWSGTLIGSFVTAMMYLGLVNLPVLPQTPMMIGLNFEILFMTAVLALRYNDERKTKLKIQQQALQQSKRIRQAREEAIQMEANSHEKLEQMVQERTLELEIALRELNEANQKLTEQNTVDSLTGVKNRAAFEKRLQAEGRLSRRQQTPLTILMIDIDRFKAINDTYGHLAGDQALKQIAQALKQKLRRPSDLVSRFGGEEFAMILPNTSIEGAEKVAESIRETVFQLPLSWGPNAIPLTISIGVYAEVIVDDQQINTLVERADKALYHAKNSGRNRVCVYTVDIEQ